MQAISVSPDHPDNSMPVTISVNWDGCVIDTGFEQTGTTFHIHFNYQNLCFATAPGGTVTYDVGRLFPGDYDATYERLVEGVSKETQTVSFSVVAISNDPSPTPAMGPAAAIVLAIAFVLIAARFHRRDA